MRIRILIAAAMLVTGSIVSTEAIAQYAPGSNGGLTNNLFQQYYTPPGASQTTAALYPAPHYVPGYVGGAYYTYQALMPHEMMYQHSRNYYNYQAGPEAFYSDSCQNGLCGSSGGGSLNVTKVRWQSGGTNHMGPLPFTTYPLAKFHYGLARNRYGLGGNGGGSGVLQRSGVGVGQASGCPTGNGCPTGY